MFKLLYYIVGIIFAYFNHKHFSTISENVKKNMQIEKEPPVTESVLYSDLSDDKKKSIQRGLVSILFFFWLIIGLFTFNWIFYVGMLLISFIMVNPISKYFKNNTRVRIIISQIYSILSWALCLFVALNSYYLKIDSNQVISFFTNGK